MVRLGIAVQLSLELGECWLRMMKRLWILIFILAGPAMAQAAPLPLGRGVSVHEWLNWSPLAADGSYRWPPYLTEEQWLSGARPITDWPETDQFRRIRSMGFDFIRLSVDPGPIVASRGERREQALAILASAVDRILSSGLKVVFDLHAVQQVPAYSIQMVEGGADSDGVARYRQMVKAVAAMLLKFGTERVALEPFNEPQYYPCDDSGTDDWQRIMSGMVADIRTISPDLTVIVTGACGGNIDGLTHLNPDFDDTNLYYSFHMYDPHSFTHQLSDNKTVFNSGMPWPADTAEPAEIITRLQSHMADAGLSKSQQAMNIVTMRQQIRTYFAANWGVPQLRARIGEAVDWAKEHHIPASRLFMGEFGTFQISADGRSGAYDPDRLRYLAAVRLEAEKHDIPWSIWEYSNPHGISLILPKGPAVADPGMLKALGLL